MFTIAARAAVAIAITITAAVSVNSNDTLPTESSLASSTVLSATATAEPTPQKPTQNELRIESVRRYLAKHRSPMTENATDFIEAANVHGLDWHLLPAIAGVESTFGKHVPANSYNPFGWANGEKDFTSWQEAIQTVAEGVERIYYQKGRNTPELMHKIYAPPSPTWGGKVRFFMNQIEKEYQQTQAEYDIVE